MSWGLHSAERVTEQRFLGGVSEAGRKQGVGTEGREVG